MPPCTRLLPCQEAAGSRGLEATPAPERLAAANAVAEVNTPAGGFSIEKQRGTQLSTLLFIHDKLKSDLICGRRRTLNRRLETACLSVGERRVEWEPGEGARSQR